MHGLAAIRIIGLLLALFTGIGTACAGNGDVLVLYEAANKVHTEFLNGLTGHLAASSELAQKVHRLPLDESTDLRDLVQAHPSAALLITVGSTVTQRVLASHSDLPVLAALMPSANYEHLLRQESVHPDHKYSAVFLDQPPDRQIALAARVRPGRSRVGVVLSHGNDGQRAALEWAAHHYGVELNLEVVEDGGNVSSAFKKLIDSSDVLVAVPDPLVVDPSNAKWLLYMAYQQRVPVIGFSEAFVKAGAVVSVFSTPEQIGVQTAQRIAAWSSRDWAAIDTPAPPATFEIATNSSVARSLGLTLPSTETLKAAIGPLAQEAP